VNATFGNIGGGFQEPTSFSIAHEGFFGPSFSISEVPIPAALPLFATGLGALGLLGWRRKRKAALAA
jgi:hypothetical protein